MIKILKTDKSAAGDFFRSCMDTDRVEQVRRKQEASQSALPFCSRPRCLARTKLLRVPNFMYVCACAARSGAYHSLAAPCRHHRQPTGNRDPRRPYQAARRLRLSPAQAGWRQAWGFGAAG